MSIYKTFKTISHRGRINGNEYSLEEYTTYYHPYECLDNGVNRYATRNEIDLGALHLMQGHNSLCSSMAVDQFGNEWYKSDDYVMYVPLCNGTRLLEEPTHYWRACQEISRHAGLPKKDDDFYEYCYKYLGEVSRNTKKFEGEYVPDYEKMFKERFKVGDRVFFVRHYDRETRNGDRLQIHSIIVKTIKHYGPDVCFLDYDPSQWRGTCWDNEVRQSDCEASVEDLCKKYKGKTLYMWHRSGACSIEPCTSTSLYLQYNRD